MENETEGEGDPLRTREWQRSASARDRPRPREVSDRGSTASLSGRGIATRRGSLGLLPANGDLVRKVHFRANGTTPRPEGSPEASSSSSSLGGSEVRAPDGGYGWVVVFASFMVNLIADGITFSFGVFFIRLLSYFGESKSKTAWVGSLFMSMPLLSGPFASFFTDRYGCRKCCVIGGLLSAFGLFVSSLTNSIELLIFFFGIVAGIGLSLCYVTAIVIVAYYFESKRSFATGLSVCGSGIGTFIFAPIMEALLEEYGWRDTTLYLAGFFLNLCVFGMLMRDLEWTKEKRRKFRNRKRLNTANGEIYSANGVDVQNSPAQFLSGDELRKLLQRPGTNITDIGITVSPKYVEENSRLFSSVVSLPTFVRNGEKVPIEVLEIMTANRSLYHVLLQNYPNLLISKSFSDSARIHEKKISVKQETGLSARFLSASPECNECPRRIGAPEEPQTHTCWPKPKNHRCHSHHERRIPIAAYLKDLRVHRHSLTYRGAMLNINRYKLRASSCPDIYRNTMTAIAKEKADSTSGLGDLWFLLKETLDFSYFTNISFLLFALSNFILYIWYDVPYVYIADYRQEMGFTEQGSRIISIIGIFNMFGEVLLGWLGDLDWVNPSFVYSLSMCFCGAMVALVPLLQDFWAISFASGAFGLFIAANYALTSIILVEQISIERFTNAYGLLLFVQGIANLVGPPLAGELYEVNQTYDLPFYLGGLFIAVSGLLLVIPSVVKKCCSQQPPDSPEKTPNNV